MKKNCQGRTKGLPNCELKEEPVELLDHVQHRYATLSKNQRKIADYLANNGITASFDSITALGPKIGVSEASLVRFAKQLGYKGYPSFRKKLQAELKKQPETRPDFDMRSRALRVKAFRSRSFKTTLN